MCVISVLIPDGEYPFNFTGPLLLRPPQNGQLKQVHYTYGLSVEISLSPLLSVFFVDIFDCTLLSSVGHISYLELSAHFYVRPDDYRY